MEMCDTVIPAYNEEHRIGLTLEMYCQLPDVRLIVVLDGCTDNTRGVVENVSAVHAGRITIVDQQQRRGKGAAVRAGWAHATAPWVGFVDADNATPPDQFMKIWNAARSNTQQGTPSADGAIGSRLAPGAIIHDSYSSLRRTLSRWFASAMSLFFGLPYHDLQCGAKVFRASTLTPLLSQLREDGMIFDIELLWHLKHHGARILEVPIEWTDQPGSTTFTNNTTFLREGFHMLRQLCTLRWRLRHRARVVQ